ncbi:MAG: sigma 54-interacting transcriptional regulator [Candidatus Eisenbacteria sp.]|nr:sigma 54-interacting transcriptional regulator [Candidatus Eisenbacteria bacterium]
MSAEFSGTHSEKIVAASPAMQRILRLVRRIAPTESNILLTGESGTGKEKVARQIHYQSKRSRGPFVAVNMAALPETLIETELFGHTRGAFTDAKRAKRGVFEIADGGTLFLDEIAEMSPPMQGKLLRVLQDREVQPVGAEFPMRVDTRIVAATNRDLREEIAEKRFREDLFYRLNVIRLHVPPLRERKEDIPHLGQFFLERFTARMEKNVTGISEQAWGLLLNYNYPGNVRELENAIERAVILAEEGAEIRVWDLPPEITDRGVPELPGRDDGGTPVTVPASAAGEAGSGERPEDAEGGYPTHLNLAEVEARHIRRVIQESGGNLTQAARSLGISRTTLWRKLKRYQISS